MRFQGQSAKSEVQNEMRKVAETLAAKAEALRQFAEGFDEMDDDDFMKHLGDKHAGPGSFQQWTEAVTKASEVRPSDVWAFHHALTAAFAEAQREVAVDKAEEKADREAVQA